MVCEKHQAEWFNVLDHHQTFAASYRVVDNGKWAGSSPGSFANDVVRMYRRLIWSECERECREQSSGEDS